VESLQTALTTALRARFTAGDNGLHWQPRQQGAVTWFELEGLQPLAFAVQGNVCILATDSDALLQSLHARHKPGPQLATVAAGFNHATERPHFVQLTGLLDRQTSTHQPNERGLAFSDATQVPSEDGAQPDFFSGNIRSLSNTFQSLDSETFVEQPDPEAHVVRQTVVYRWKH
jgi:hypothetical protein